MYPKFATSSGADVSRRSLNAEDATMNNLTLLSGQEHAGRMRDIIESYISSYKSTVLEELPQRDHEQSLLTLNKETQHRIK